MPLKFIGRTLKKVVTVAGAIVGIGNGALVATGEGVGIGEMLTGEVVVDLVVIIGCMILIAINGKDGVPDWLIKMAGGRIPNE